MVRVAIYSSKVLHSPFQLYTQQQIDISSHTVGKLAPPPPPHPALGSHMNNSTGV